MTPVEGAPYGEGLIGRIDALEVENAEVRRAWAYAQEKQISLMQERTALNTALLEIIEMLEHGYFPYIEGHLSEAMCCDGRMCGCHGASVGEYIAHHIRQAAGLSAQGTSASGQDPQGLEAKPAGPARKGAPEHPSHSQD